MGNIHTLFVILIAIALVLFTISYIIDSDEIEVNTEEMTVVTGKMQSFEVFHGTPTNEPTKKTTARYDEKLLEYLDRIQESKDNTFQKGKVFLRE